MRGLPRINQTFAVCLDELRTGVPLPAPRRDLSPPTPSAVADAARRYFDAGHLTRVVIE